MTELPPDLSKNFGKFYFNVSFKGCLFTSVNKDKSRSMKRNNLVVIEMNL